MEVRQQIILIVDDNTTDIEAMGDALAEAGEAGPEILFASSPEEGLAMAVAQQPDLLLLNASMGGMEGNTLCAHFRASPETSAIPILLVTPGECDVAASKGLELGAIDCIGKPFNPLLLRARVRNLLELKRYRDLAKSLSATDGLTGLANRHQFEEFLSIEWRRGIRSQFPLSLVLIEIDCFKSFNEHYGHWAGDETLRQLAGCLAQSLHRSPDLAARLDGKRFACALPETGADGAYWVAHRVQQKVEQLQIPHEASTVTSRVTVSLGVATTIPTLSESTDFLVKRAEKALAAAKQNGRNQIR